MLEHHADPGTDRALAVGDRGQLAVDEDLTGIGLVEAVQDRHQRGLARPVFADDPVDRALGHRDVDVLVRLNRTKGLGDALQFDGKAVIGPVLVGHVFPLCHRRPPLLARGFRVGPLQMCRANGLARHLSHCGQADQNVAAGQVSSDM